MVFPGHLKEMEISETLKSMGLTFFYLLILVIIKASVYLTLVKVYKLIRARYYDENNTDESDDKHLFDYESDWESQSEEIVDNKSEDEFDDRDTMEPMDHENCQEEVLPDEEISQKAEELVSTLRERKPYLPMTDADFNKLVLGVAKSNKSNASSESHSQPEKHFKET